jgi:hypothetical protein
MRTIREIYNAKSKVILGRLLMDPATEADPRLPEQLNLYLTNVSQEIYCEGRPIRFDPLTRQIGDLTYIDLASGEVADEDGNVLFKCFDEYLISNVEPTLLFLESFVSKQ